MKSRFLLMMSLFWCSLLLCLGAGCSSPDSTLGRPCDGDGDCASGEVCGDARVCVKASATLGSACESNDSCGVGEICGATGVCERPSGPGGDTRECDAQNLCPAGKTCDESGRCVDEVIEPPFVDPGIPDRPPATTGGENNSVTDTDCDGLSDAEEFSLIYGFREDGTPIKTDPNVRDTDGDGILDGIEMGRAASPDPLCGCVNGSADPKCGCSDEDFGRKEGCLKYFYGDADPATTTSPGLADTDGDGIPDGEEDKNHNGRVDDGETDPNNWDTDGDGLSDADEINLHKTDPTNRDTDGDGIPDKIEVESDCLNALKADTDGDGCLDGAEDSNRNGRVDAGETNPCDNTDCGLALGRDNDCDGLSDVEEGRLNADPNKWDTDGDGLSDGDELGVTTNPDAANCTSFVPSTHPNNPTNPLRIDSDCDGLTDGQEIALGTDPNKWDTDGDGLSDGLERGVTINPDPTNCAGIFVPDADPSTTTDPLNPDSDGDGIQDGAEDSNQNGRVDAGELNPNNRADGQSSAVQAACATANLKQIAVHDAMEGDIRIAVTAEFSEVTKITNNGKPVGVMLYNPTKQVVGIVLSKPPAGAHAYQEDSDTRSKLSSLGGLSGYLQPSSDTESWDHYKFAANSFIQNGNADLKAQANAIVQRYYGGASGLLAGSAGATGPFWIETSYVYRSSKRSVVVMALTTNQNYTQNKASLFELSDTSGGSALAQFGDTNAAQCEIFETNDMPLVDIVWAVDNSGSMGGEQTDIKNAAAYMISLMERSAIDWRMAAITSEYDRYPNAGRGGFRSFTTDETTIRNWFDYNHATGFTYGGSGDERLIYSAQVLTEKFKNECDPLNASTTCSTKVQSASKKLRPGALLVFIFMGDENDDYLGNNSGRSTTAINVFKNYDGAGSWAKLYGLINYSDGANIEAVIDALQGIHGSIDQTSTITPVLDTIITDITGSLQKYEFSKSPIASTIKLAFDQNTPLMGGGVRCDRTNVPRNSENGYEYNATYKTILFYGDCRPTSAGYDIAASYRYWNDLTPDPDGIDITDLCGECHPPFECDLTTNQCVCPSTCGGNAPPADPWFCDTTACAQVCPSDCGGCGANTQCNPQSCSCECVESMTCNTGFVFDRAQCGCVCNLSALQIPEGYEGYEIDPELCGLKCKENCGGKCEGTSKECNPSTCGCDKCQENCGGQCKDYEVCDMQTCECLSFS